METEIINGEYWLPVKGHKGIYEVSTAGNVRSCDRININTNGVRRILRGKLLNPSVDSEGYLSVSLRRNGKQIKARVHRLVAIAFVKNIPGKNLVDHIDRNRINSCVSNLRWVDYIGNRENCVRKSMRRLAEAEKAS